ncbi:MAG: DMT family transporter [Burkholderiales bacterium]
MSLRDGAELLLLAAIWGASFLFMRIGGVEFGAVAVAALRVAGAALLLMPLLALRGQMALLREHWRPIFVVGVVNSALPFLGFAYALLSITAGLSAIFNATAPIFGAFIAWLWLGERLTRLRVAGLALGFAGVVYLAPNSVNGATSFKPGSSGLAIIASLAAAALYGFAANYTRRRLTGVAPLTVAAGSQLAAALCLALPAVIWWPAEAPSARAWTAMALLAFVCTGFAYLLFFRLIAHAGAANAIAVTYLVPLFAMLWGGWFLAEQVTLPMVVGGAVILLGTALATGMVRPLRAAR